MRAPAHDDRGPSLGSQLRRARLGAGLTLRQVARDLGVSASFVSQLENGKSQPSVATLSALARLLSVSLDQLFPGPDDTAPNPAAPISAPGGVPRVDRIPAPEPAGRPGSVPPTGQNRLADRMRLSVTTPGSRTRLVLTSGVIWEQLSRIEDRHVEFIEVSYPPRGSSPIEDRMLRHTGQAYGYLVEGELRVTLGSEEITLRAGDAIGLDARLPHLIENVGVTLARGIWFIHHDTFERRARTGESVMNL